MLTQKNIDDLVKIALKKVKVVEDAQDIVFDIIQDLLEKGIRNINFHLVYGRIYFKYLANHIAPFMYELNKTKHYFQFINLEKIPTIVTHMSEIKIDCLRFIQGLKTSLNPLEYAVLLKLANGNDMNGNDRANLFRARKRFKLTLREII